MLKNAGFSLIELVIVLMIVSILAVLPMLNWPGTVLNVGAEAKQFADDVRFTQALAMAKSERYRIVKTSTTSYQIQNGSGAAITMPNGSTTMTLNTGLSFGSWLNLTNNLIAFDGRGTPYLDTATPGTALSAGTTYTITITSATATKNIVITPITGRVILQ